MNDCSDTDTLSIFGEAGAVFDNPASTDGQGTGGTQGTSQAKSMQNSILGGELPVLPEQTHEGTQGAGSASLGQEVDPRQGEPLPAKVQRPGFANHYADFVLKDGKRRPAGLWWHGTKQRGGELVNEDVRIADPIEVIAISRDEHGGNFGRKLRFVNAEGQTCERVLPMRLLSEGGADLRRELLDMGHTHSLKHRAKLADFIMESTPQARIVAATTTGWHDNARAFVLPHRTLGNQDFSFSAEAMRATYFEARGSLDGWRQEVAGRAQGNPILIFCLCVALAGPLIWPAKQQAAGGLGFNLRGASSKGKTTGLQAAASVWGSPQFLRPWSATGNGIEALAASQNDTCMVLDELSQASPFEAGSMVYMVANGVGKQRAARTGGIRESQRWRSMLLSSGERTLASHLSEAGKTTKAGQDARLLDIPATGRLHGAFDDPHGMAPSDFANAIKTATAEHYGHAGMAFIDHLLRCGHDLPGLYRDLMLDPAFSAETDGVASRAAGAFGLLAMAGELATEAGITGWHEGEALEAVITCFALWKSERGSLPPEDAAILDGVNEFIQRHGDARFAPLRSSDSDPKRTNDRAGFWCDTQDGRVFYFNSAALREAAKGYDIRTITAALDIAGWLYEKETGKRSVNKKVQGSTQRLIAVLPQEVEQ
ncbi:DUF927 domain-containing protein [Halomonas saccharevitans]|uniref:DUF927 domain-containing protein n=1 Tax=Halomonas saccharevitans TaxID=416872 RepID=A0ABU3NJD2_9GAMM|nr:DUF927 domain-containing protein [Halomonas saccharevitans]MDT8880725.1 DUF927 domain-containing protein [Halomonas saccharevitans]